jgi:hypothetical protein
MLPDLLLQRRGALRRKWRFFHSQIEMLQSPDRDRRRRRRPNSIFVVVETLVRFHRRRRRVSAADSALPHGRVSAAGRKDSSVKRPADNRLPPAIHVFKHDDLRIHPRLARRGPPKPSSQSLLRQRRKPDAMRCHAFDPGVLGSCAHFDFPWQNPRSPAGPTSCQSERSMEPLCQGQYEQQSKFFQPSKLTRSVRITCPGVQSDRGKS